MSKENDPASGVGRNGNRDLAYGARIPRSDATINRTVGGHRSGGGDRSVPPSISTGTSGLDGIRSAGAGGSNPNLARRRSGPPTPNSGSARDLSTASSPTAPDQNESDHDEKNGSEMRPRTGRWLGRIQPSRPRAYGALLDQKLKDVIVSARSTTTSYGIDFENIIDSPFGRVPLTLNEMPSLEDVDLSWGLAAALAETPGATVTRTGRTVDALLDTYWDKPMIPEASAGLISRLFFFWHSPFMHLGYERPITTADLFRLPPYLECKENAELIQDAWDQEVQKRAETVKVKGVGTPSPDRARPIRTGFLGRGAWRGRRPGSVTVIPADGEAGCQSDSGHDSVSGSTAGKSSSSSPPNLVVVLFRAFQRDWIAAGVFMILSFVGQVVSPLLLDLLMRQLEVVRADRMQPETASRADPPRPIWYGYALVIVMFLAQMVSTLANSQFFIITVRVGLRARVGLTALMYKKLFRLTVRERIERFNSGTVLNLVSTDTFRLDKISPYLHFMWAAPIVVLVVLILLLREVGVSALIGIGVLALLLQGQGRVMRTLSSYRALGQRLADQRIKWIGEMIQGIKVLKLLSWESTFLDRIRHVRMEELGIVRKLTLARSHLSALAQIMPSLCAIVVFSVFAWMGNTLESSKVFATLALFNVLRVPLLVIPLVLGRTADANVAMSRIANLLAADELSKPPKQIAISKWGVQVSQASFTWDVGTFCLTDIHLRIPSGSLVAIVGPSGAGKTSLLLGMLGEMRRTIGQVTLAGTVAYVPQQPWLQNATVRANILFGLPYDHARYWRVLRHSALDRDLAQFPDGEDTELQEQGTNLSGGQRARIGLARALYKTADVYFLDDPLSALDAHVGSKVFQEAIVRSLRGKTRLLVLHSLHLVSNCDFVIYMDNGRVVESGPVSQMRSSNGPFMEFMRSASAFSRQPEDERGSSMTLHDGVRDGASPKPARASRLSFSGVGDSTGDLTNSTNTITGKTQQSTSVHSPSKADSKHSAPSSKFCGDQGDELSSKKGSTTATSTSKAIPKQSQWPLYRSYLWWAGGPVTVIRNIFPLLLSQLFRVGSDYWLAAWTDSIFPLPTMRYMVIFFGLGMAHGLFTLLSSVELVLAGLKASKRLHHAAVAKVAAASMRFFDTTPPSFILNRFSRDQDIVDSTLPETIRMFLHTAAGGVASLGLILYTTPWFALPMVPLLWGYTRVQRFYRSTRMPLKILDDQNRNPWTSYIDETYRGITLIRVTSGQAERFQDTFGKLLDLSNRSFYLQSCTQRWLLMRLELVGNCLVLAAGVFGVAAKGRLAPSLVGLSITYALQMIMVLNMCVRQAADVDTQLTGFERLDSYATELPNEEVDGGTRQGPGLRALVPAGWPKHGEIVFTGVTLSFRPGLPPVLKGVNLTVPGGQKVAIVGRTGSGKSTILLALFRLLACSEGTITLDGIDISKLPLSEVRRQLFPIPQDPRLFSGTIRSNLVGPQEVHDDSILWECLECVGLKSWVEQLELQLDAPVAEAGDNFSVGQRQLLCLARALVRKPFIKVLALDEATAALDEEAEASIQHVLRNSFTGITVLAVAHRLHTILDFDQVIVMSKGCVVECGKPADLRSNPHSMFSNLVQENPQ